MNADNQAALTKQIQALLAEVFHVDISDIPPDLAFGDLPQWDSMGHMDLMLSLETNFGVEISAETITELTSMAAICKHISEHQDG